MPNDAHGAHDAQIDLLGGGTPSAPPKPAKPPKRYDVPALNTGRFSVRPDRCRGEHCGTMVYWVAGKKFPISCHAPDCYPPTDTKGGVGISHYADCPDAAAFSGRNRGGRRG